MRKRKDKSDSFVLVLRAKDYEGCVVPQKVTQSSQHAIVIKAKETRKGDV